MLLNLPKDLVEEIVSRLPMKYMRALKLTCKTLYALSQSPSFMKLHISKEATPTRDGESMIVLMDYNLYLISFVLNVDSSAEHKGKLTCLNEQVKISQVFSCEGLLLCVLKEYKFKLVVWNPYLGQTRWIEPRYSHRIGRDVDSYRYALGYVNKNNSCRSHKVLRFIDNYISLALNHAPENRFSWYEIYDIETDLWTTLDVPPYWRISCYQRGVSLKGNTYFCATKWNSGYKLDDHIICFDFTSERFGPLMRLPFRAGHHDYVTLSCVREEKLAALLTHNESNPYEFEIWITTKIESEKVSWSKILEMDTGPLADRPIAFTYGSFFIDEEKKVSMGFDALHRHTVNIIGEAGYFIELDLGVPVADINSRPHLCPYLPNSVQIKQPPGGKRKRKTILEKRRYDQNMLRLAAFIKRTKQEGNKLRKRICKGLKKKTILKA